MGAVPTVAQQLVSGRNCIQKNRRIRAHNRAKSRTCYHKLGVISNLPQLQQKLVGRRFLAAKESPARASIRPSLRHPCPNGLTWLCCPDTAGRPRTDRKSVV